MPSCRELFRFPHSHACRQLFADWAIAFYEGTVKHIFFVAETKGSMDSLELRPIERAKIACAKKLFRGISTNKVVYHEVDS